MPPLNKNDPCQFTLATSKLIPNDTVGAATPLPDLTFRKRSFLLNNRLINNRRWRYHLIITVRPCHSARATHTAWSMITSRTGGWIGRGAIQPCSGLSVRWSSMGYNQSHSSACKCGPKQTWV